MPHKFIINEDVYRGWNSSFTPVEQPLIEWAQQLVAPDTVFLDVGAHVGDWAVGLSPFCRNVHAFEPQGDTYWMLRANVDRYPNIQCHKVALSDLNSELTLFKNSPDGGSSTLDRTPKHTVANTTFEHVTSIKLDVLDLKNISLIKLDVEGCERRVILGAQETLKANNYPKIIFEAWPDEWYAAEKARLMATLDALGYKVGPVNWRDTFLAEKA